MAPLKERQGTVTASGNGALMEVVVEVIRDRSHTRVVLAGEIDMHTVESVRETLEAECDRRPDMLSVDMSAVEFVDSHALSFFAKTHRCLSAAGSVFMLVSPTEHVRRALALTELDELLLVEPPGPTDRSRPSGSTTAR